jgi:hypothetical protein
VEGVRVNEALPLGLEIETFHPVGPSDPSIGRGADLCERFGRGLAFSFSLQDYQLVETVADGVLVVVCYDLGLQDTSIPARLDRTLGTAQSYRDREGTRLYKEIRVRKADFGWARFDDPAGIVTRRVVYSYAQEAPPVYIQRLAERPSRFMHLYLWFALERDRCLFDSGAAVWE